MARDRLIGAVLAVLIGFLASCGGRVPEFDPAEVEALVRAELEPVLPRRPTEVRCETVPPRSEPGRAPCAVGIDGADGDLAIEIVSDGDGGIEVRLRQAVLVGAEVTKAIDDELEERHGRSFTVDCDVPDVLIVDPGAELRCTGRDEDHERGIVVTVVDAEGTIEADIADD